MAFTIYRRAKGKHYVGLGRVRHSEDDSELIVYRCLYETEQPATWTRPRVMFEEVLPDGTPRFAPIARVRVVYPEDEREVLAFGFDAWSSPPAEGGTAQTLEAFVASYETSRNHLRGTRYLLELLDGQIVADLNTLRFARGVYGIASVATAPAQRGRGYATLLLRAVLEIVRFQTHGVELDRPPRFLLFSEVPARTYEGCGFRVLPDEHQRFLPSIAMATGDGPLDSASAEALTRYF
jgi:GNAT superfamily N-acetyltransferase